MQLANQEAQRFNQEYIGTEHILLGLVKEGTGVASKVLQSQNVELRRLRLEVEKLIQSGPEMITMGKLPQTPKTKKVIEIAMEEARNLDHDFVGTEHFLLALLRVKESVAQDVLVAAGLNVDEVRDEVQKQLGRKPVEEDSPKPAKMTSAEKVAAKKKRIVELRNKRLKSKSKGKSASAESDVDKICDQILQLSSGERMEVLKTLWEVGGSFSEQTPRLAIKVLKCVRVEEIIQIEIEVTNVSLNPIVISGFQYFFPSLVGEGTCYCFCRPGDSKELAFGIQGCTENEATVALMGFNPQQGFPENDGAVIHGFIASVDE